MVRESILGDPDTQNCISIYNWPFREILGNTPYHLNCIKNCSKNTNAYLCETGYSVLVAMNIKYRSRSDSRLELTKIVYPNAL